MASRIGGVNSTLSRSALHSSPHTRPVTTTPRLTSRSGSTPLPFQVSSEISPGKNALLRRATAGFTPPSLGHKSFAEFRPLALVGSASYPVLVHRPASSTHASSPRSVALPQLRFASFTVASLWRDLHPQESAYAGRTQKG